MSTKAVWSSWQEREHPSSNALHMTLLHPPNHPPPPFCQQQRNLQRSNIFQPSNIFQDSTSSNALHMTLLHPPTPHPPICIQERPFWYSIKTEGSAKLRGTPSLEPIYIFSNTVTYPAVYDRGAGMRWEWRIDTCQSSQMVVFDSGASEPWHPRFCGTSANLRSLCWDCSDVRAFGFGIIWDISLSSSHYVPRTRWTLECGSPGNHPAARTWPVAGHNAFQVSSSWKSCWKSANLATWPWLCDLTVTGLLGKL